MSGELWDTPQYNPLGKETWKNMYMSPIPSYGMGVPYTEFHCPLCSKTVRNDFGMMRVHIRMIHPDTTGTGS